MKLSTDCWVPVDAAVFAEALERVDVDAVVAFLPLLDAVGRDVRVVAAFG